MKLLCRIYRHKFDEKAALKSVSGWCPFVPFVTCERCGKRFSMVYSNIWGWFGPIMCCVWWVKNRLWHIRCDFNRWCTRNEPPPF